MRQNQEPGAFPLFFPFVAPAAVAFEISKILDCGLDKQTLMILIGLIENGANPEALASGADAASYICSLMYSSHTVAKSFLTPPPFPLSSLFIQS